MRNVAVFFSFACWTHAAQSNWLDILDQINRRSRVEMVVFAVPTRSFNAVSGSVSNTRFSVPEVRIVRKFDVNSPFLGELTLDTGARENRQTTCDHLL